MEATGDEIRFWFPRTRGDRPAKGHELQGRDEVPPHARG